MNSRFTLIHKKAQEQKLLKNFLALLLTQRPTDDWQDALDHLAIGLVANKCTELAKISEILLLT